MHKHFSGTQTMQALKEDTSQNFKWTCNGCKQNVPCMTNLSLQLKSIEEKTHNKISILEQKMDDTLWTSIAAHSLPFVSIYWG
jgi:hypothetical protein